MSSPSTRTAPCARQQQAEQHRQGRRLAGAVAAQQRRGDAALDGEADAADRERRAVALDEVVDDDDGLGHRPYMANFRAMGQHGGPVAASMRGADMQRTPPQGSAGRSSVTAAAVIASAEPRAAFDRISLRRLVLIRWVAVARPGADAADRPFRLGLPPAAAARRWRWSAARCCSISSRALPPRRRPRLGEREAALYLGYDMLQLGGAAVTSPAGCRTRSRS